MQENQWFKQLQNDIVVSNMHSTEQKLRQTIS